MTELYGWKPTSSAKLYLDENDRRAAIEREAARNNTRDQASRDWLAEYLSQPNRPTRFDWSPKLVTATQIEEVINAEAAEQAFLQTSREAANQDVSEGMGDAAAESGDRRVHGAGGNAVGGAGSVENHDWLNDPIPF